jgi:hypothetical protein
MAIDNSPPRLKLITTIGVITVVTLFGLNFVLESYYAYMSDEAMRAKIAPTTDRARQHEAEQAALTNAQLPIDQAIAQLAREGRAELISPRQSDDVAAMTGWSNLPKPAPTAPQGGPVFHDEADAGEDPAATDQGTTAPPPVPPVPAPTPAADAGVRRAPAADAGAPRAPREPVDDAGVRRPAPRRDAGGDPQQ